MNIFAYGAYSGNHGVDLFGGATVVHQLLFEEEVHFSVVGVGAIWDEVGIDKSGL